MFQSTPDLSNQENMRITIIPMNTIVAIMASPTDSGLCCCWYLGFCLKSFFMSLLQINETENSPPEPSGSRTVNL